MKQIKILLGLLLSLQICPAQEKASFQKPDTFRFFNGAYYELYELEEMRPRHQAASSHLADAKYDYSIASAMDGKPSTAWVEGEKGAGEGAVLEFYFEFGEYPPDVIAISPGLMANEELWYANNRVAKISIQTHKNPDYVEAGEKTLIDEFIVEFETDQNGAVPPGTQYISIGQHYLQNMGYMDFDRIFIKILEVDDADAKYDDTCIAEIVFLRRGKEIGMEKPGK